MSSQSPLRSVVLLACLAGACHCFAEDQPAPTFFVAPGGNDGWAGRLPTANAGELTFVDMDTFEATF